MKKITLLSPALLLILGGCGSIGSTPKSERYQMEMTLQKTRADIEEVKHDVHTQKMELSILDGKMLNQEDAVSTLKKETLETHQAKLSNFDNQIHILEKKLAALEKEFNDLSNQMAKISQTSNEMVKALAQSKERLNEVEKTMSLQAKATHEVAKLKKSMEKVTQAIEDQRYTFVVETYRVRSGDTLDTIAKERTTNIETLKKINQLETDKVFVGQEIFIPSAHEES